MNCSLLTLALIASASFCMEDNASSNNTASQAGLKRRFSEKCSKKRSKSSVSYGKVFHNQLSSDNGSKWGHYTCGRCDIEPVSIRSIYKHMHNECFPTEGLPCIDCVVVSPQLKDVKFSTFQAMLDHNIEKHYSLSSWRCFGCDTNIKKRDFFNHFVTTIDSSNFPTMMGEFKSEDIFLYHMEQLVKKLYPTPVVEKKQKKTASANSNKKKKSSGINNSQIPWQFFTMVGEINNRTLIRVNNPENVVISRESLLRQEEN